MKSALMQLKERIEAISSGGDEMIKTKDLLDAIDIYLMFERQNNKNLKISDKENEESNQLK